MSERTPGLDAGHDRCRHREITCKSTQDDLRNKIIETKAKLTNIVSHQQSRRAIIKETTEKLSEGAKKEISLKTENNELKRKHKDAQEKMEAVKESELKTFDYVASVEETARHLKYKKECLETDKTKLVKESQQLQSEKESVDYLFDDYKKKKEAKVRELHEKLKKESQNSQAAEKKCEEVVKEMNKREADWKVKSRNLKQNVADLNKACKAKNDKIKQQEKSVPRSLAGRVRFN